MSDARSARDNRYRIPLRKHLTNIAELIYRIGLGVDWLGGLADDADEQASGENHAEIKIVLACDVDEIRVHLFILATRLAESGLLDPKRLAHEWGDAFSPTTLLALRKELDVTFYDTWCERQGIRPDPTDAPVNLIGAPDA